LSLEFFSVTLREEETDSSNWRELI